MIASGVFVSGVIKSIKMDSIICVFIKFKSIVGIMSFSNSNIILIQPTLKNDKLTSKSVQLS